MTSKAKGEPLSLDHLGELAALLIDNEKLEKKLGFAKPKRANTWGDLVRWGLVTEGTPRKLTERGEQVLRRVATVLAGHGYYMAECPGCKKRWRIESDAPDPRCDCNPKAPFRLVSLSVTELVNNMTKRGKR